MYRNLSVSMTLESDPLKHHRSSPFFFLAKYMLLQSMYMSSGIFAFKTLHHIMTLFPDINFLLPDKRRRLNSSKEKRKATYLIYNVTPELGVVLTKTVLSAGKWSSMENCAVTRH